MSQNTANQAASSDELAGTQAPAVSVAQVEAIAETVPTTQTGPMAETVPTTESAHTEAATTETAPAAADAPAPHAESEAIVVDGTVTSVGDIRITAMLLGQQVGFDGRTLADLTEAPDELTRAYQAAAAFTASCAMHAAEITYKLIDSSATVKAGTLAAEVMMRAAELYKAHRNGYTACTKGNPVALPDDLPARTAALAAAMQELESAVAALTEKVNALPEGSEVQVTAAGLMLLVNDALEGACESGEMALNNQSLPSEAKVKEMVDGITPMLAMSCSSGEEVEQKLSEIMGSTYEERARFLLEKLNEQSCVGSEGTTNGCTLSCESEMEVTRAAISRVENLLASDFVNNLDI